jgi:hypothetical protein
VQEADLAVFNGAELSIEAGVEYVLAEATHLEVGWNDEPASLYCIGTSEAPVEFRGDGPGTGRFEGLIIQDSATSASRLENVEIRGAGANDVPPLSVRAPIHLTQVTVRDSATAVEVSPRGVAPDSEGLMITGCDEAPIVVAPNALVTLPVGDYGGNVEDHIVVTGGEFTEAGVISDLGFRTS